MKRVLNALLIGFIRAYQYLLSPLLPPVCRFEPSCSNYGLQALRLHGPFRGSWLTTKRICRCHPFHPGGYDPVPELTDGNQEERRP
jgi:uncharacterized protein